MIEDLKTAWPVKADDLTTLVGHSDRDGITKAVSFLAELGLPSLVYLTVDVDLFKHPKSNIRWVAGPDAVAKDVATLATDPELLKTYGADITQHLSLYWTNLVPTTAAAIGKGVARLERFVYDFDGVEIPNSELTEVICCCFSITE